jgi:hypothetical protein
MKMPPEILTALLRGEHLGAEQREELGLLPEEALRYRDVVAHLAGVISRYDWFPRPWEEHVPGQSVDETIVIQNLRLGAGAGRRRWPGAPRFVCHARRHAATDPRALVEEAHKRFWSARRAAEFYLHFQLGLPGDLDGWKVVR